MLPSELVLPVTVCGIVIAACWLLSIAFREYSWVDRIWSIIPPVYVGLFAAESGGHPRLVLMTVLTALWGARLTFNYARKGGYAPGGEDYRWAVLRSRMSPARWHAFNLGFIATYQNVLLLLITLPAWTAARHSAPLGGLDLILAVAFLGFLGGELWADQQQWRFHQQKKALAARGEAPPIGFLTTGLWAYSRHPNFFCELAQWWIVYLFAVVASGALLHGTIIGPALLTLLFHGSANFTEELTASKYPGYSEHQRRVSRILPWRPAR